MAIDTGRKMESGRLLTVPRGEKEQSERVVPEATSDLHIVSLYIIQVCNVRISSSSLTAIN